MRFFAVVLAVMMAMVAMPVEAKRLCGAKIHEKFGETRARFRDYLASCRPDGVCVAVTYILNDKKEIAYLYRLGFKRVEKSAKWQISLTSVEEIADMSEGFVFKVDRGEDMRVPPEFLSAPESTNQYVIADSLTEVLLPEFEKGGNVAWMYKTKQGGDGRAFFSLRGVTKAMAWAVCVQGKD